MQRIVLYLNIQGSDEATAAAGLERLYSANERMFHVRDVMSSNSQRHFLLPSQLRSVRPPETVNPQKSAEQGLVTQRGQGQERAKGLPFDILVLDSGNPQLVLSAGQEFDPSWHATELFSNVNPLLVQRLAKDETRPPTPGPIPAT